MEQAENCGSFGDEENTLIRDTFIFNMLDHDTQKELLKETVLPTKALKVAVQMEMGAQNQQKINQNLNIAATNSVNAVNNFQTRNCNATYQPDSKDFTLYSSEPKTTSTIAFGPVVVQQRWSHNHCQTCPANRKKCKNCGITGHFAWKYRKPKKPQEQSSKSPQTTNGCQSNRQNG